MIQKMEHNECQVSVCLHFYFAVKHSNGSLTPEMTIYLVYYVYPFINQLIVKGNNQQTKGTALTSEPPGSDDQLT